MENTAKAVSWTDFLAKNVYVLITMFLTGNIVKGFLVYIYIYLTWPPALEHGKIEENTANSGIFKGLGRQGNWKHFRT